ncbi:MAG: ATP synthase F1 subunit delta [Candidatus Limimorpha sp.]
MKDNLLVRRYAKAFLEFAINNKIADEGLADLELVTDTLKENRELRYILSEPFVSPVRKTNIIKKIFQGRITDSSLRFIEMIIGKKRTEILTYILESYKELYLEHKNIAIVTITTAIGIDEETKQKLLHFVKDKARGDIKVINKIDKGIIGGFIINYLDYQYDASIRTKLKNLERAFTNNLYVKGY